MPMFDHELDSSRPSTTKSGSTDPRSPKTAHPVAKLLVERGPIRAAAE